MSRIPLRVNTRISDNTILYRNIQIGTHLPKTVLNKWIWFLHIKESMNICISRGLFAVWTAPHLHGIRATFTIFVLLCVLLKSPTSHSGAEDCLWISWGIIISREKPYAKRPLSTLRCVIQQSTSLTEPPQGFNIFTDLGGMKNAARCCMLGKKSN